MITSRKFIGQTKYYIVCDLDYTNISYGICFLSISTGRLVLLLFDSYDELLARLFVLGVYEVLL